MTTEQKKVLEEAKHKAEVDIIKADLLGEKIKREIAIDTARFDNCMEKDEELSNLIEAEVDSECACGIADCECELCDGSGLTVVGAYDDIREVTCPCVVESREDTKANA